MPIMPLQIHTWGFSEKDLDTLPEEFSPNQVVDNNWPGDFPVVIHSSARGAFHSIFESNPDIAASDTLLYLALDAHPHENDWLYFDEYIQAGDWDALRKVATHPLLFKCTEWADVIPEPLLYQWDKYVDPIEEISHLLNPSATSMLKDPLYKRAFNDAVHQRRVLLGLKLPYSEAELLAYRLGKCDPQKSKSIASFLESSVAGQAIFAQLETEVVQPILKISLVHMISSLITRRVRGSHSRQEQQEEKSLGELLSFMMQSRSIRKQRFTHERIDFYISYDPGESMLTISTVEDDDTPTPFRVSLLDNEGDIVNTQASADGQVQLFAHFLLEAFEQGASEIEVTLV